MVVILFDCILDFVLSAFSISIYFFRVSFFHGFRHTVCFCWNFSIPVFFIYCKKSLAVSVQTTIFIKVSSHDLIFCVLRVCSKLGFAAFLRLFLFVARPRLLAVANSVFQNLFVIMSKSNWWSWTPLETFSISFLLRCGQSALLNYFHVHFFQFSCTVANFENV